MILAVAVGRWLDSPRFARFRWDPLAFACLTGSKLTLPDGREAAHEFGTSPQFGGSMPWAERVEEFTADGMRILRIVLPARESFDGCA